MESWLPLFIFGLSFGILMVVLSRYQANRYQTYLNRHTESTKELVAAQQRTQEAVLRQTAALERIADALEKRP
jgi:hypothetical protein